MIFMFYLQDKTALEATMALRFCSDRLFGFRIFVPYLPILYPIESFWNVIESIAGKSKKNLGWAWR